MAHPETPQGADDLEETVADDIAGVQGGEEPFADDRVAQTSTAGSPADQPAPDGAEIEWAGGVVKKPPAPTGGS